MSDSKKHISDRFLDRSEAYRLARPGYPEGVRQILLEDLALSQGDHIVDMGAGTGIFSRLLKSQKFVVTAVEPNKEMLRAAERDQSADAYVEAPSEKSGLDSSAYQLWVAAQAFHWFDIEQSRKEAIRLLDSNKRALILWNIRKPDLDEFHREFEEMFVKYGTDYKSVRFPIEELKPKVESFFGAAKIKQRELPNTQVLDWEGLKLRVESASYVPRQGTPGYSVLIEALRGIFERHQSDGRVSIQYGTFCFWGSLKP